MSEPVIEPPKEWNRLQPGGYGPVSSACLPCDGESNSGDFVLSIARGHAEGLRRTRGEAAGEKLGAAPIQRNVVNMGTALVPSAPAISGTDRLAVSRRNSVGRSRRSTPRPGKPATWGRAAARSQPRIGMPGGRL